MTALLVGYGYWGRNWARTLHNLGELGAVCEAHPEAQAALKTQYPEVSVYADLQEALAHTGIEAVVLATPVITHAALGRQCLHAGKAALIEKPLAFKVTEAEELVALAEAQDVPLAVGHLLLYHPALLKLKDLMDDGELGEILAIQNTRVNLGKVRNEENVWWSLAPHDLSIISMLLDGAELTVKDAFAMPVLGRPDLPDSVLAHFASSQGIQVSVHASWLAPVKRHETLVIGSKGIAVFDDAKPPEEKLSLLEYSLDRQGDHVSAVQRGTQRFVAYESADELLAIQAKAFLAVARGKSDFLPNDGQNGLAVVRLLNEVQLRFNQAVDPAVSPVC